ncbi:MAG: phosphonate ABC transporter ATP-binding protein [ANME-2 cluster archaeon]|nr:phosphonate ABC transporter ATP-binding protein [ANME-2 cluster archaeon]MBC2702492.1 phosphonate ABC transporter ATP-binding protein [ANME-2 cluster archaeon]MBC2707212.1 phosphonate ABC transporter ATP-binding protein [ANME-2 cluster archaeon]MBC2762653.1 phosphonate ABC transporter ATP-binding protein [ANME-2 cluster archaeon]
MLTVTHLSKKLPDGKQLLRDINFSVERSEFVAILGLSGTGKTILLRCLNGLTVPDGGEIILNGNGGPLYITSSYSSSIKKIRQQTGMIFQNFNLVKRRSVIENVLIGKLGRVGTFQSIFGKFTNADIASGHRALERVGISDLSHRRAGTLSGGEQQRVAIARSIIQDPNLLLADEPVANLDPTASEFVMEHLRSISVNDGVSTLAVLHQPELARKYATRILGVRDGVIVYDGDADISDYDFQAIYGSTYNGSAK